MAFSVQTKNFTANLTSNFGVQAFRFFTMTLLARRLGTDLFGVYNYVILLLSYGFLIVEFGLRNVGIREFAHGRGSKSLVSRIIKVRLGLALVAVCALLLLTRSAFPKLPYAWPAFYLGASLFMDAFLVDYILVAGEALIPLAIGNLGQAGFLFFACYFFVGSPDQFLQLTQFYFISHLVWALIVSYASLPYSRKFSKNLESASSNIWSTLVEGSPFMIATFVSGVMISANLLLLGQFHQTSWLGPYSAALKILGIALGVINALLAAVQPRFAKLSADPRSNETRSLIDATTRFLWLFIAPAVIGCWLFGNSLVGIVFGAGYESAGPLLKPLSLAFAFYTLALPPMTLLFVSHHTTSLLKIVFFNFVISLVLVGGSLAAGHPELVPWCMAIVNACFLISAWKWFGSWGFFSFEILRFFALPVVLLAAPLLLPIGAIEKFVGAAAGFMIGLALAGVWKQPWFTMVLGQKPLHAAKF